MFRPYTGEYLVSPFALHLGLNYCSHGCWYCFANLNQPGRRMDGKSIKRMLDYLRNDSTTIEADLLRQGYSVLTANDSDPCAASNADQMREALPLLMDAGITFGFQTKGGDAEVEEIIVNHPPTVVYISLTSDDDDILKRAEPGAPSFARRLRLAERCAKAGHFVVAGINPLIPGWWEDFDTALALMQQAGITRAWIGSLHLNNDQIANLTQGRRDDFAGEILAAKSKAIPAGYLQFQDKLHAAGTELFGDTTRETLGFWREAHRLTGAKLINTANDALHQLAEIAKAEPNRAIAVKLAAWQRLLAMPHRAEGSAFKEFIKPFRRTLYDQTGAEPKIRNIAEVNALYWQAVRFPRSPIGQSKHVAWPIGQEGARLVAKDGTDVILVTAEPSDEPLWPYHERPVRVLE